MSVRKYRIACQKLMQKQKQKSSNCALIFNYTVAVVGIPFEAFRNRFSSVVRSYAFERHISTILKVLR